MAEADDTSSPSLTRGLALGSHALVSVRGIHLKARVSPPCSVPSEGLEVVVVLVLVSEGVAIIGRGVRHSRGSTRRNVDANDG